MTSGTCTEQVPIIDQQKPPQQAFYMPMHAVRKKSSITTKTRVVFDASAKSASGVSLNDTLMVVLNIHPPLADVMLRFRLHHVSLTADVSKMYRAVELADADRDYHRFVWRSSQDAPLIDYRMTNVTFEVSASSFAANMSVKQNAVDFTVSTLHKWKSSDPAALSHIHPELKESHFSQLITESTGYTKTLGIEWISKEDVFRLTITDPPDRKPLIKRLLTSDIAKTFEVLG